VGVKVDQREDARISFCFEQDDKTIFHLSREAMMVLMMMPPQQPVPPLAFTMYVVLQCMIERSTSNGREHGVEKCFRA